MSRDSATLGDISIACQRIARFKQGFDRAAFLADIEKQSAVLHQLLVVGEAIRRLPPDVRARHPAIPWAKVGAMRNFLIHSYDRVDLDIVWDTIDREVPRLLAYVEPLVPPANE